MRRKFPTAVAAGLLAAWIGNGASAQTTPAASPAIDGILAAFETHPLVGIGDAHGLAQEQDFYAALLRDPRFAERVGNVVVEFGGAAHQDTVDRYVNGEDVPYSELRKVWSETVGWVPYPGYVGFKNVYAQIRATNLGLPPERRIKVWLGEPRIDWSTVATAAQLEPLSAQRDSHAAEVIRKNLLQKNRRALVIYGTSHFERGRPKGAASRPSPLPGSEAAVRKFLTDVREGRIDPATTSPGLLGALQTNGAAFKRDVASWGPIRSITFRHAYAYGRGDVFDIAFANETRSLAVPLDDQGRVASILGQRSWLVDLVENQRPGAFFIAAPYTGFEGRPCEAGFETAIAHWPKPALAPPAGLSEIAKAAGCDLNLNLRFADAVLYFGPGRELLTASRDPDIYLDDAFRKEMSRRNEIMTGRPLGAANVAGNPVVPTGFRRGTPPPS